MSKAQVKDFVLLMFWGTLGCLFLYWTITFNEKNNPIFINDVYQLDNELAKKLTYKL